MLAHIYPARNKKFLLILTETADISIGGEEILFDSKVEAKAYAKEKKSTPHNYK